MGAVENTQWRDKPPRLQKMPATTWLCVNPNIAITNLPKQDMWNYITFLFEELEKPRTRLESQLKDRYEHCYEQSKHLGLTSAQWIGCGWHKQVFALEDTVPPRAIKLFYRPGEWRIEKRKYDGHVRKAQYLLPHEYYQHYAICDRVEVIDCGDSIQHALDQGKITNTDFAKKIINLQWKRGKLNNLGFYQDKLVWIDIADYKPL